MKELPSAYDPQKTESRVYKLWEKSGFFNPDKLPARHKKPFAIVISPPNVTGSLHMGHALEIVIEDTIVRKKRMEGYKTLWLPGTDHAGIATQHVVERELKKEGKTRHDIGREKFEERVWAWKEKYGDIILNQLKKMGASYDWSRTRFTMDEKYKRAVLEAFIHYYKKGWLYEGERTINWCPGCGTSLSDLEIEYKEEKGKLYYIKYGPLSVATVRPETKLGDTALAVNPKDKRYKEYVGKEIAIKSVDPEVLQGNPPKLKTIKIKVITDDTADPKFGTGVIKVTPAHDLTDFEIYVRHPEIPILQVIGQDGRMTKAAGARYQGMKVKEAREQIVKDLEALGLLEKVEEYTHNVAICYRCNSVLEPLLSKQWFLKMHKLAELAVKAVKTGEVKFVPRRWEKIYFSWLNPSTGKVRDWNISRQLWWGHRLPVWYHEPKCVPKPGHEKDIEKCKELVVSAREPKCRYCDAQYIRSEDVLDTWFSSALWPFATLGWPDKNAKDLKTYYPTDVISSDRGIINLWIARMVFSSYEFLNKKPYHDVVIHATVLTKEGQRMSKSKGTGIDPLMLIEKYGADATRFGLAYQMMGGQDIRFSEDHVMMGKKFCNKLWNATRYILLQDPPEIGSAISVAQLKKYAVSSADNAVVAQLERVISETNKHFANYRFGQAAHALYKFFWHSFADVYIEKSKAQIKNASSKKDAERTKKILLGVHLNTLKLLHPMIPFVTEELYQHLPLRKRLQIMVEKYPQVQ